MKLIVGLGNPDKKYQLNRHNIGFIILDEYAKYNQIDFKKNGNSMIAISKDKDIILLKPQQYMNNSGTEVSRILNYYKIDLNDLLIVYDDKDIEFKKMRLRNNSSSGGHNGIKDIINYIKPFFLRLKVGINNGRVENTADFVLSNFSKEEITYINNNMPFYFKILDDFAIITHDELMNKYNGQ